MNAIKLILLFFSFTTSFAKVYEGAITKVRSDTYTIRTASKTVYVQLNNDADSKKLKERFENNIKNPKIEKFDIPNKMLPIEQEIPFGTRGDCGELPVSISDLTKIIEDGGENMGLVDFLEKIPKGSLESFTFITNTRSLQRGEGDHLVDEQNPRILRQSMDGKITISFVCHPLQEKHNSVEIIYFDDNSEKFKTLSYNFNNPLGHGEGKRIHHSPKSCVSCHGTNPKNGEPGSEHLKLNWPEYFFWGDCDSKRGVTMYGMSDDNMGDSAYRSRVSSRNYAGCTPEKDLETDRKMKDEFIEFKKKAETDPCLKTLPWAKLPAESKKTNWMEKMWSNDKYKFYPYARSSQDRGTDGSTNYSLRTNLRFTDVYGHLTARRNARLIKDNSNYDKIKHYLAMEALGSCLNSEDLKNIEKKLNVKIARPSGQIDSPSNHPVIHTLSNKLVEFSTGDWTMHLPANLTPNKMATTDNYITSIPSDDPSVDFSITDITLGEILKDVVNSDNNLKGLDKDFYARGVERGFGLRFSCIDDLGQGVKKNLSRRDKAFLCNELRKKAEVSIDKEDPIEEVEDCSNSEVNDEMSPIRLVLSENEKKISKNGKELAKRCIGCHTGNHELAFVPQEPENLTSGELRRLFQVGSDDTFWDKVQGHLTGELSPRMPFMCEDNCLNEEETASVVAYLKSAANGDFLAKMPETDTKTKCVNLNGSKNKEEASRKSDSEKRSSRSKAR